MASRPSRRWRIIMADTNRLSGQAAVVTGGASGFGEGIVRRFVAEGARVGIADIDEAAARRLAAEMGPAVVPLAVDVADAARVAEMATEAQARLGPIGIVVNNAGVPQAPGALTDMPDHEFDRLFAINARSVFLTSRAFVPAMAAAGGRAVVSSVPESPVDEQLFAALGESFSHLMAAPIRMHQRTVGFIVLDGGPSPFGAEELDELEQLLSVASEAYGRLNETAS